MVFQPADSTATTPSSSTNIITVTLPLSPTACSVSHPIINNGTPLSFSLHDGGLTPGAGTSVYIGVQHHTYLSYAPNHLTLLPLTATAILINLGSHLIIGTASEWLSGDAVSFNTSSPTPPSSSYGPFYPLPVFVDEVVLLSTSDTTAIVVGVGGGGAFAARVDVARKTVVLGAVVKYVSGASVDTDTAAIDNSTFAISYYVDGPGESIDLETITGKVSASTLNITFGIGVVYSPNHEFHQILSIGSGLFALAFPHDNESTVSVASPMGVMVGSVNADNVITIWSSDGLGTPWLQPYVLGYYFFDMLLVNQVVEVDGMTSTVAMAVVDRAQADALTILTFTISATTTSTGAGTPRSVSCIWGRRLTVTQAGATIGYNYFTMQPLFSLLSPRTTNPSASASFTHEPKRDFAIAWQDTAKQGAVEAVIVSYSIVSGSLTLILPTTSITTPIPITDPSHWWIAGGSLPDGRMLLLTTLDNTGNLTLIEHLGPVVGLSTTQTQCLPVAPLTVDVAVSGVVEVVSVGRGEGVSVWATSRGGLVGGGGEGVVKGEGGMNWVSGG